MRMCRKRCKQLELATFCWGIVRSDSTCYVSFFTHSELCNGRCQLARQWNCNLLLQIWLGNSTLKVQWRMLAPAETQIAEKADGAANCSGKKPEEASNLFSEFIKNSVNDELNCQNWNSTDDALLTPAKLFHPQKSSHVFLLKPACNLHYFTHSTYAPFMWNIQIRKHWKHSWWKELPCVITQCSQTETDGKLSQMTVILQQNFGDNQTISILQTKWGKLQMPEKQSERKEF